MTALGGSHHYQVGAQPEAGGTRPPSGRALLLLRGGDGPLERAREALLKRRSGRPRRAPRCHRVVGAHVGQTLWRRGQGASGPPSSSRNLQRHTHVIKFEEWRRHYALGGGLGEACQGQQGGGLPGAAGYSVLNSMQFSGPRPFKSSHPVLVSMCTARCPSGLGSRIGSNAAGAPPVQAQQTTIFCTFTFCAHSRYRVPLVSTFRDVQCCRHVP